MMIKSSRKYNWNSKKPFWDKVFRKMTNLLILMEELKGDYDIDDPEIRWVEDRINYWNTPDRRLLTKGEMGIANDLWITYNGPINVIRKGER